MAHFAQIDNNGLVLQVIVVHNNELLDENGIEREYKGVMFCCALFGGIWLQTSYNGSIRKNFAGVGYKYDWRQDAFIPPKPFNSWVLNEDTCQWQAPVPYPTDGRAYFWDESALSWSSPGKL